MPWWLDPDGSSSMRWILFLAGFEAVVVTVIGTGIDAVAMDPATAGFAMRKHRLAMDAVFAMRKHRPVGYADTPSSGEVSEGSGPGRKFRPDPLPVSPRSFQLAMGKRQRIREERSSSPLGTGNICSFIVSG